MRIKNFLSHVKTRLMSWRMMLNCTNPTTMHIIKLHTGTHVGTSGCMTLNCPLSMHDTKLQTDDTMHGAFSGTTNGASPDAAMYGAIGSTNGTSTQTTPDLDRSPSMDSSQTHDSLVTPESPRTYSPSPHESLEEGTNPEAQVRTVTQDSTQVTQVRTDSLTYDSLITALSWLSLEPRPPDPYQNHQ